MVMKRVVLAGPISESPLIISCFLFKVKFMAATALCMCVGSLTYWLLVRYGTCKFGSL
jgi:hypothetical protein